MARKLDAQAARTWRMHQAGLAISEIAALTKRGEHYVRSVITGIWADGGAVSA